MPEITFQCKIGYLAIQNLTPLNCAVKLHEIIAMCTKFQGLNSQIAHSQKHASFRNTSCIPTIQLETYELAALDSKLRQASDTVIRCHHTNVDTAAYPQCWKFVFLLDKKSQNDFCSFRRVICLLTQCFKLLSFYIYISIFF